ncbi:hypothetical protein [Cohnella massiliensis]|uniref:hypothetical protein n=1 Tax=Cohnella massiliensis TaxID=1816691 RepID=UPI0009B9697D|nr:hypothetical protein [Cohnella massiliensis]
MADSFWAGMDRLLYVSIVSLVFLGFVGITLYFRPESRISKLMIAIWNSKQLKIILFTLGILGLFVSLIEITNGQSLGYNIIMLLLNINLIYQVLRKTESIW